MENYHSINLFNDIINYEAAERRNKKQDPYHDSAATQNYLFQLAKYYSKGGEGCEKYGVQPLGFEITSLYFDSA